MRRIVLLIPILCLPACWALEHQRVGLDPKDPVVAELVAQYHDNPEVLRQKVEDLLDAQVSHLEVVDGTYVAVLEPPLQEAVEDAATSFIGKIVENPTAQDAIAAGLASILIALGVIKGRARLRKGSANGNST